jgi:UPF0755 protein
MRREKPRANNRITRGDLLKKTPYNTYQMVGLPQGPIANPGIKSLQAVLNPAEVNYLYFVSKNDRTHYFSSTLEEHNRAVALYQRRLKKPGNPDSGKGEKNPPPASRNGKISG